MIQRKSSRLLVEQLEDRLTPSTNAIPAGQFNWTQFSPSGALSQLVWEGQTLVYQTWNGAAWQSQDVATSTVFTQPTYTSRDQMMTASQTAQLVYTTDGTAHALFLEYDYNFQLNGWQTLIRDYVQTANGWVLSETLTPPWVSADGPGNLIAAAGPNNSISLVFTETAQIAPSEGQFGSGTISYATNQSGKWVFSQIATTTDIDDDVMIEGERYAPRFLSLAVAPDGAAYVTYTPEFYISGNSGTVDSTLMLASNASGSWQSSPVVTPNGPGDAGLAASVAVAPDGQVAVASYYVERYSTGSAVASWLIYSTLNPNGTWTSTVPVNAPNGYVAADGPNYTGFAPQLTFNAQSQPTIVFSDEASQHLADTGDNEYAGQIRSTTLVNGTWVTTAVLAQTNPLVNQLFYPVSTTYDGVTVYAGVEATSTLNANDDPVSMSFSLADVFTNAPPVSPPPVSPPPAPPVSPPPVSPPPVVTSPPPVSPPPVVTSPPPVSPPPVLTSPPPVSPPPVSPPPVLPPPVVTSPPPVSPPPAATSPPPVSPTPVAPPPVVPVLATTTLAGRPTEVSVTYSNGSTDAWYPFGSAFTAGATVALGDVTGGGVPDIVVASGNSGTPGTVQVYDGVTRKLIATYRPFGAFGGGLVVAVGAVKGTGPDDIVVGVLGGGWPVVDVLNGATGKLIDQFIAYPTTFAGGVRLGVGDVNGDGDADIVVGPGVNAHGLPVKVYSGKSVLTGISSPKLLASFVPFPAYNGAISVAVGDLTSTGFADIVLGTQSSGGAFAVYSGNALTSTSPKPLFAQMAWASPDNSGIKLALVPDAAGNSLDDLIVANGAGGKTARYTNADLTPTGWLTSDAVFFTPIAGVTAPIYVG